MRRALAALTALAGCGAALVPAGCGGAGSPRALLKLPPEYRPLRIGRTAAYRPPAVSRAVAARRQLAGMRCTRRHGPAYGIHLELYARRLVVPVPAGIGVAPPQRRQGAYVRGGACSYPIRTFEPTGVIVVDASSSPPTLGTMFGVWGQRVSATTLAGFKGPVIAFVNGRRWQAAAAAIPLRRHAEIVLEVGRYVVPHPAYRFPPGL